MTNTNSLRKEIESWVIAHNNVLREAVKKMSIIILLRNIHPTVRSDYAYKCRDAGLIKPDQVSQFLPKLNR
jgi:hypothetical protein